MKIPTWAILIGICMLLFGGCEMVSSTQAVYLPDVLEMQSNMMKTMQENGTFGSVYPPDSILNSADSSASAMAQLQSKRMHDAFNQTRNIFSMSAYAKKWIVVFGYMGVLVGGFYFLSGIFLLVRLPFSIRLVFIALIISIVFNLTQTIVMSFDQEGGFMSKSFGIGNLFGVVLDVVLLIVLMVIDKSTYLPKNPAIDQRMA